MNNQSTEIKDLAVSLAKVQATLQGAKKDSANPFFKSKYADLESVWDACRALLTQNGLSVIQTTDINEYGPVLVTTLAHASGQWISGRMPLNPVKNDPQGMGSAITYARRYALAAIVGVVQTDDDGEAAMNRGNQDDPAIGNSYQGYRVPAHVEETLIRSRAIEDCDPRKLSEEVIRIEKKYQDLKKPVPAVLAEFVKRAQPIIKEFDDGSFF